MLISRITLGDRVRKDMGDLQSLADSMKRGLLHPVVVTRDNLLVAGHRRIEAAKILGWSDIAATVIDVADLLTAERDENSERKDFTPSEAVEIKRLIAAHEAPRMLAAKQAGGRITAARRSGNDLGQIPRPCATGGVLAIAAKATGMSATSLQRAEAVVVAAEADPAAFGDLSARMDETGNVNGAHRELEHRRNGTSGRHAIHHKRHTPKTNDVVRRAVSALEGICAGLAEVDPEDVDAVETKTWRIALESSSAALRRFAKGLKG